MRRRLTKIGLSLLLLSGGAIVNVAVAWGCAFYLEIPCIRVDKNKAKLECPTFDVKFEGVSFVAVTARHFRQTEENKWTTGEVWVSGGAGWPVDGYIVGQMNWQLPIGPDAARFYDGRGWPFVSLWCEYPMIGAQTTATVLPSVGAVQIPHAPHTAQTFKLARSLPLRLAWPGFAINTIFYAAILGALFFAPSSVRRALRRRSGLCPACAYPIGTSPVCTECGNTLDKLEVKSRKCMGLPPPATPAQDS